MHCNNSLSDVTFQTRNLYQLDETRTVKAWEHRQIEVGLEATHQPDLLLTLLNIILLFLHCGWIIFLELTPEQYHGCTYISRAAAVKEKAHHHFLKAIIEEQLNACSEWPTSLE